MAMTAHDEMKLFWKKNLELKRPNSPWWIYRCYWMSLIVYSVYMITAYLENCVKPGNSKTVGKCREVKETYKTEKTREWFRSFTFR